MQAVLFKENNANIHYFSGSGDIRDPDDQFLARVTKVVFAKYRDLIRGNFTKRLIIRFFIPVTFPLFAVLVTIAWAFYPHPYEMGYQVISNLGNPVLNPFPGWVFFSVALVYLAVMMIPMFMYAYRKLRVIYSRLTKIGTIANFIGLSGFLIVALFPNLPKTVVIHNIGAICSFLGISSGAIVYWVILTKEAFIKAIKFRFILEGIVIVMITLLLVIILLIGFIQIVHIKGILKFVTWYLEFPFWEWTLFLIIMFHLFLIDLMIPKEIQREPKT